MLIDVIKSKKPVEYGAAVKYMENRVQNIINGTENPCIWFLEHPHVYTAGRSANDSDLLKNSQKIPVIYTNRGGKFTYHGPGQRIIYLMLNLKQVYENPDIRHFVQSLENWIITSLQGINIYGEKKNDRIGIWVKDKNANEEKIAAIGIHIKKWITMHGISINYSPKLNLFKNIIPCGIRDYGITSIKKQKSTCNIAKTDSLLLESFIKQFGCEVANIHQKNF